MGDKLIGAEYLVSWLLNKAEPYTKEVKISVVKHFGDLIQDEANMSGVPVRVLRSDAQIQGLLDNYPNYFIRVGDSIEYNKEALTIPRYTEQLELQVYMLFLSASVKLSKEGL